MNICSSAGTFSANFQPHEMEYEDYKNMKKWKWPPKALMPLFH